MFGAKAEQSQQLPETVTEKESDERPSVMSQTWVDFKHTHEFYEECSMHASSMQVQHARLSLLERLVFFNLVLLMEILSLLSSVWKS